MKERPILFNGDMVRAILSGEKTQTRRMVKYIPAVGEPDAWCNKKDDPETVRIISDYRRFCPFGEVGDRLWVREAFGFTTQSDDLSCRERVVAYCAGGNQHITDSDSNLLKRCKDGSLMIPNHFCYPPERWTPSIHMPRWASRITLEIVSVRVERLQDITDAEARAEGFKNVGEFADCWNSIYKNWHENPWVWVVAFKMVDVNQ